MDWLNDLVWHNGNFLGIEWTTWKVIGWAGNAVFFSSHILEIVQNMCDRVIIIDKGRILADAPVTELREMQGDRSLEDIFLELTGGKDVDDMVKELGNVG